MPSAASWSGWGSEDGRITAEAWGALFEPPCLRDHPLFALGWRRDARDSFKPSIK
jgi:hypothetical protein